MTETKIFFKSVIVFIILYIICTAYGWIGSLALFVQDGVADLPWIMDKGTRGGPDSNFMFLGMYFIFSLFRQGEEKAIPFVHLIAGLMLMIFFANVNGTTHIYRLESPTAINFFKSLHAGFFIGGIILSMTIKLISTHWDRYFFDPLYEGYNNLFGLIIFFFLTIIPFITATATTDGIFNIGWFTKIVNSIYS